MKRQTGETTNSRRLTRLRRATARQAQTPYTLFGALLAGLLVVLFCLLLLWHDPLVFWNDDYELSVLPVFADMARSWSEGHWPILSPYSWVCGNLTGEFQYGTFSVFVNAVVIFIWKFPLTFPQQAAALSIAHLFALAIGAFLLARDRRTFHRAPVCSGDGRILACARPATFNSIVDLCRAGCCSKRLVHLLGRDRLVRRAQRVYLAALGMVGSGARNGSTANEMAIPLAGAVRLPRRHRRISVHSFDDAALDRMVGDQGNVGAASEPR